MLDQLFHLQAALHVNTVLAREGETLIRRGNSYELLDSDGSVMRADVDVADLLAFACGTQAALRQ